jgi:hypothetical protein
MHPPDRIPAELLRSIPRDVRLTATGRFVVVIANAMVAGALLSGILLGVLASRDRDRSRLLEAEAISTQADVIEVQRTGSGSDSRRRIGYRFTADGRTYSGRASLRNRESRNLRRGSVVEIHYLSSNPERNWIARRPPRGVPIWAGPVVSASCALLAFALWWTLRKQRRLLAEGRAALARVTETKRVQTGNHRVHRVGYEFHLLSGASRTGSFDQAKNPPPLGSTLTILYFPDDPRRQARYPLSMFRVR